VGCAFGALAIFDISPGGISPLVFFGAYCLLIGYLIVVPHSSRRCSE
jgi:hypothetical protein